MRDIVAFEGADLDELRTLFDRVNSLDLFSVRFHVHTGTNGGLQLKANGGIWTSPYGKLEQGEQGPSLKERLREIVAVMKATPVVYQSNWDDAVRQLEELTH